MIQELRKNNSQLKHIFQTLPATSRIYLAWRPHAIERLCQWKSIHRRSRYDFTVRLKRHPEPDQLSKISHGVCCSTPSMIGARDLTSTQPPPDLERGGNGKHKIQRRHSTPCFHTGGPIIAGDQSNQLQYPQETAHTEG